MEIELVELAQTFFTGGYLLLGLFLLYLIIAKLFPVFRIEYSIFDSSLKGNIFLLAIFFLAGATCDNYSKSLLAHRKPEVKQLQGQLVSDSDLRFESLIEVDTIKYYCTSRHGLRCKKPILELFKSIHKTGDVLSLQKSLNSLNSEVKCYNDCLMDSSVRDSTEKEMALLGHLKIILSSVSAVYYQCKNIVYARETYYDELKSIEFKRTYLCSVAFCSYLLCMVYLISSIVCFFGMIIASIVSSSNWFKLVYLRLLLLGFLYYEAHKIASDVYYSESTGYYLRCVGYCAAIFDVDRN